MISYASIDRIEGSTAVCEMELVDVSSSKEMKAEDKEIDMVNIPTYYLERFLGKVEEGDIIALEQVNGEILDVYFVDEEEKQRRINLIKELVSKI